MPAQITELKVQDVAIKLHRAGSGPTVLFLHGAGGVPQWLPFFDTLAERYELLVPEHPGFGGSDVKSLKRACCCRPFIPGGRVVSFFSVRCMRSWRPFRCGWPGLMRLIAG